MAIFSDLELNGIMNEAEDKKFSERIKDNTGEVKTAVQNTIQTAKDNLWINKKKNNKKEKKFEYEIDYNNEIKGKKFHASNKANKITFKEDADGNIIDCSIDDEVLEEGIFQSKKKKVMDKAERTTRDLSLKASVAVEKEKQEWNEEPGAKTGEMIGNAITGGNMVNTAGKFVGRNAGGIVDKIIKKKTRERKKIKEEADYTIFRSEEFTRAMNEYFDITDTETRKVLLAVNEADQNKVLVSLTSKLYDSVVDKVDDIDFGGIEMTKGDIRKLPNYSQLTGCLDVMKNLLIEFKQDTKPVDTITECIDNMIDSRDIWTKAYAVNAELPMITYNTMVLAIIEATAYLVSMSVEFIKSPSQDTMQIMIDKSALTKSKGHMLFKNIESFNNAYRKGQVEKAMMHIIDESAKKKNFVGFGIYGGIGIATAVVGLAGVLFCIIPIIRELIFLFYYYRVRVSDFFEVQADLLQVNAHNVENNRLDLTKEERKSISSKQMKTADKFRSISRKIAVEGSNAQNKATKDIKNEENKKYKASDVMDELPDSASSALF